MPSTEPTSLSEICLRGRLDAWWLSLVCFVMGLMQGPTFPTNSVLLSRWVPPQEKSWASSISNLSDPLAGDIYPSRIGCGLHLKALCSVTMQAALQIWGFLRWHYGLGGAQQSAYSLG